MLSTIKLARFVLRRIVHSTRHLTDPRTGRSRSRELRKLDRECRPMGSHLIECGPPVQSMYSDYTYLLHRTLIHEAPINFVASIHRGDHNLLWLPCTGDRPSSVCAIHSSCANSPSICLHFHWPPARARTSLSSGQQASITNTVRFTAI